MRVVDGQQGQRQRQRQRGQSRARRVTFAALSNASPIFLFPSSNDTYPAAAAAAAADVLWVRQVKSDQSAFRSASRTNAFAPSGITSTSRTSSTRRTRCARVCVCVCVCVQVVSLPWISKHTHTHTPPLHILNPTCPTLWLAGFGACAAAAECGDAPR